MTVVLTLPARVGSRAGRAAELSGFDGGYVPFDPEGAESLSIAAGVLRESRHLRVTAGFHPGIATPVYAAKLSASLQRFSADRLGWRVEVDLDPAVARAHGDFLEGTDRYARADEFLTVAKGVWRQGAYTFEGRFYQVLDGGLPFPLSGRPFPLVHLSGSSPQALELSARHADVHVFEVGEDVADLGRVERALRLPVLARQDEEEAAAEALRTGFTGLTGSYERVAEEIRRHAARGIGTFLLEARPHLEEAYRLGEHLLPLIEKERAHAG
jgi:alkanesulfonate monooxygenase